MTTTTLNKDVKRLEDEFDRSITEARTASDVEALRIQYLGRKGSITGLFNALSTLPLDDRRTAGRAVNDLKQKIHTAISDRKKKLSQKTESKYPIDITLPGNVYPVGRCHPLTAVLRQIKDAFRRMGFSVVEGLEVETEYYNFEALNIPKGHPARDMHDTLFVGDEMVLRTHTSPVQIRVMENQPPPVRIISPGRCYRRDTPDATHSPAFHQVEGLCVDEGVTFADLKGVILTFAKTMFGSDMNIRFRPSFFPFTEPSAEYDFSCLICKGSGCRTCKGTGWIEISGAGMVNPEVYKYVGYDSEKYTGYAFGMGVERVAMLMYEIPDIRLFYENDIRFLQQF